MTTSTTEGQQGPPTHILLRAAQAHRRAISRRDPWVQVPDGWTTFTYGLRQPGRPFPIGAAYLLWDAGKPFRARCADCGGERLAYSFGAGLAIGCIKRVCTSCGTNDDVRTGGLTSLSGLVRPVLADTEWKIATFIYGGAVGGNPEGLTRLLASIDALPAGTEATVLGGRGGVA